MNYKVEERLITVDKLNLSYGDRIILRDINLSVDNITRPGVKQGQVVALLGPSGIGKTQLFRCIAGLQPPTSGHVLLGDKDRRPVQAGEVGVVAQSYPLLSHRTVYGNLKLVSSRKPEAAGVAEQLLSVFGLSDKKDCYPVQLSGGQRQRVAIIQQLIASNHMLLMDEPFSGLDVVAKERVMQTIREVSLQHELNTTIFTTHDIESAVALADAIWVLGREKDKPGATIVKVYDLAAMDLAWTPQIERHPKFWPLVLELKDLFKVL